MAEDNHYFQVSTVLALLNGVYEGDCDIHTLQQQGDFGLGTFNQVDGEMVVHKGRFYRCDTTGKAHLLSGDELTPFATVTQFSPTQAFELTKATSLSDVCRQLDAALMSTNDMHAIEISGLFDYIQARSVCALKKPYEPLTTALPKAETIFEWHQLAGSMVVTRFPQHFSGINVPDYHFHFIEQAGSCGGHVYDFSSQQPLQVRIATIKSLQLQNPSTENFYQTNINNQPLDALKKMEAAEE